jgi:hypothetical protein
VLDVRAHHARLVAGKETRQLIGRRDEINDGDDEENGAQK